MSIPVKYLYTFYGKKWHDQPTERLWSLSTNRLHTEEEIQEDCKDIIRKMYHSVTSVEVDIIHTHTISGIDPVYNDGIHPIHKHPEGETLFYLGTAPDYGEFWIRTDDNMYIRVDYDDVETWPIDDPTMSEDDPDWVCHARHRHQRNDFVKIKG